MSPVVIFFLGIAPGWYQAMLPAFISGWDAATLKARVASRPAGFSWSFDQPYHPVSLYPIKRMNDVAHG
jgi:hypothetical protein